VSGLAKGNYNVTGDFTISAPNRKEKTVSKGALIYVPGPEELSATITYINAEVNPYG